MNQLANASTLELLSIADVLDTAARRLRILSAALLPLKRICSWCNTVVTDGTLPATHVLCPGCARKMEAGYTP